jgi:SAM-dependent methyltransferase
LSTTEPATDPAEGGGRLTSNPLARDPSAWVVRFASRLQPGTRVLDVAWSWPQLHISSEPRLPCHRRRQRPRPADGRWPVKRRWNSTCDLERDSWPFDGQSFDAVIVIHYLHRPLLPHLAAALAPGGLLVYETFAVGNEQFGRPRNPDYLLRPRELLDAFAELRVLAFEDGFVASPAPAMVQRLAALKLERSQPAAVETLAL